MNISADIFSRMKDIARRRHEGLGGHFESALRQWFFLLAVGLILALAVVGYAYYNFSYWNNIEARVAEEDGPAPDYDQAALGAILSEFDQRAVMSQSIINRLDSVVSVSTSTATEAER